jgi:hypothetical protein
VGGKGGVVHSFTGTAEEAQELVILSRLLDLNCILIPSSSRWIWAFTLGIYSSTAFQADDSLS